MGLKYTKRAMTSYEVHRFFHGLEISFFPDTLFFNPNNQCLDSPLTASAASPVN